MGSQNDQQEKAATGYFFQVRHCELRVLNFAKV
jgi:hypothetical protein